MRRNSGLVGKLKDSAFASTSGKYDTFDQFNYKKGSVWPLRHTATLTSSSYTCTRLVATTVNVATEGISNGTYNWSATVTGSYGLTATSGTVTITNGSGSFTVTPSIAATASNSTTTTGTIPSATFTVSLKDADGTTVIGTSQTYTIPDAVFTIAAPSALTEGSTGNIAITATNTPTNTYFTISLSRSGGAIAYSNNGYVYNSTGSNSSSTGTSSFSTTKDWYTTGAATFTAVLRYNGYNLCTSTWTVADSYPSPTIYLNGGTSAITVNEGQTFTVSATVPDSTSSGPFQFLVDNDYDSTGGGSTAYYGAGSNSALSFTSAYFPIDIYSDNNRQYRYYMTNPNGTIIAYSPWITVVDKTPSISQVFTSSGQEGEGYSVTYQINGTNLTGNTITWSVVHGTTTAADFTGSTSGSFYCSGDSNQGNFSLSFNADKLSEGSESFSILFQFTANGNTTTLTTWGPRSISDLSAVTITGINLSPTSLNEGTSGITITLSGSQLSGETISWAASGGGAGDLSSQSGTMSGTGSLFLTAAADLTTEGAETFILTFTLNGNTLYTSSAITINDTSLTPPPAKDYDVTTAAYIQKSSVISYGNYSSQYSKMTYMGPTSTDSATFTQYGYGSSMPGGTKFLLQNSNSTPQWLLFDSANEAPYNSEYFPVNNVPINYISAYEVCNFSNDGAYFVVTNMGYNAQYGYSSSSNIPIRIFTCSTPWKFNAADSYTEGYTYLYETNGSSVYGQHLADIALSHDGTKIILSSEGTAARFWVIPLSTPYVVNNGSMTGSVNANYRRNQQYENVYSYNDYSRHAYGEFEFNKDGTEVTFFKFDQSDSSLGCQLDTYALSTPYSIASGSYNTTPLASYDARLPSADSSGINTSYPSTWFGKSFCFDRKNENRLYVYGAISSYESWVWEFSITKEVVSGGGGGGTLTAVAVHNVTTAALIAGSADYDSNYIQRGIKWLGTYGGTDTATTWMEVVGNSYGNLKRITSTSNQGTLGGMGNTISYYSGGSYYGWAWVDTKYKKNWGSGNSWNSCRYVYLNDVGLYTIYNAKDYNPFYDQNGNLTGSIQTSGNVYNITTHYTVNTAGSCYAFNAYPGNLPSFTNNMPGLLISYLDNTGTVRIEYISHQSPDYPSMATMNYIGTMPSYGSAQWDFNKNGTEITFLVNNELKTYALATAYDISSINSTLVRSKSFSTGLDSSYNNLIGFNFSQTTPYNRMVQLYRSWMNSGWSKPALYSLAEPVTPYSYAPSATEATVGVSGFAYINSSSFSITFNTAAHATQFKAFLDSYLQMTNQQLAINVSLNGTIHYLNLSTPGAQGATAAAAAAASTITGSTTVLVSFSGNTGGIVSYYGNYEGGTTGYNTVTLNFYQYTWDTTAPTLSTSSNAYAIGLTSADATALYNAFVNSGYGAFDSSYYYDGTKSVTTVADSKSGEVVKSGNTVLIPFDANLVDGPSYSPGTSTKQISLALTDDVYGVATPVLPANYLPLTFGITNISYQGAGQMAVTLPDSTKATKFAAFINHIVAAINSPNGGNGMMNPITMNVWATNGSAQNMSVYSYTNATSSASNVTINGISSSSTGGGPANGNVEFFYSNNNIFSQGNNSGPPANFTQPNGPLTITFNMAEWTTAVMVEFMSANPKEVMTFDFYNVNGFGYEYMISNTLAGTVSKSNSYSLTFTGQNFQSYSGGSTMPFMSLTFGAPTAGSMSTNNYSFAATQIQPPWYGSSSFWFSGSLAASTFTAAAQGATSMTVVDGNGNTNIITWNGSYNVSNQGWDWNYNLYRVVININTYSMNAGFIYGGTGTISAFTPS